MFGRLDRGRTIQLSMFHQIMNLYSAMRKIQETWSFRKIHASQKLVDFLMGMALIRESKLDNGVQMTDALTDQQCIIR